MTMNLGDLLGMIRQDYLDTLLAAQRDAAAQGAVELEAHTGQDSAPAALLWHDLLVNGRPQTVTSEGVFSFPTPITFGWGDALPGQPAPLTVVVHPFAWDAALLILTPAPGQIINPEPFSQWLTQWGQAPEPTSRAAASPFREVVHQLGWLGPTQVQLDFGSAPLEAWQDLLEAVLASGARSATFTSPVG